MGRDRRSLKAASRSGTDQRRGDRRKAVCQNRSDHTIDDEAGETKPRSAERQPQEENCGGKRNNGAGREPADEAVRRNARYDEALWREGQKRYWQKNFRRKNA